MATNTEGKTTGPEIPVLQVSGTWDSMFEGTNKQALEQMLPGLLKERRWFGGKGRPICSMQIVETFPVPHNGVKSYVALVRVSYREGDPENYVLPLSYAEGQHASDLLRHEHSGVLLRVASDGREGVLYDGVRDGGFVTALLDLIEREGEMPARTGSIDARHTTQFETLRSQTPPGSKVMGAEQSNSSVVFGDRLIMKLFRRVEGGTNPDLEIGQFLTEHGYFNSPPVAGSIEIRSADTEPRTLAILQGFVPNQGDAWKYTLGSLQRTLENARTRMDDVRQLEVPSVPIFELTRVTAPQVIMELAGDYLRSVRLLAQRTAELHLTLDSDRDDPNFAPEEFSRPYQEAVYHGMRRMATAILELLRSQLVHLQEEDRAIATELISHQAQLLELFRPILIADLDAERIRIHGDYHLGQVLYTGEDFVIIDFEGEPLRSLSERRIKRSPLRDVAGMLRSFDYAGQTALAQDAQEHKARDPELVNFLEAWTVWASSSFLQSYLQTTGRAAFLPADEQQTAAMLDAFRLDKAMYELGYEINNRPTWVHIPLAGIARILRQQTSAADRSRAA